MPRANGWVQNPLHFYFFRSSFHHDLGFPDLSLNHKHKLFRSEDATTIGKRLTKGGTREDQGATGGTREKQRGTRGNQKTRGNQGNKGNQGEPRRNQGEQRSREEGRNIRQLAPETTQTALGRAESPPKAGTFNNTIHITNMISVISTIDYPRSQII